MHRILLVEDDADDEALTVRVLSRHHLLNQVTVVHDGAEALAYLFGSATSEPCPVERLPEVVLLDLKLPRVSGHEVLRRIRAEPRTRMLPVVILTSSGEESDLIEGYTEGANSYVRKPVDFADFSAAVEQLGMYWLLLNTRAPVSAARTP